MNFVGRVGIALFGLFWMVSGLATLGSSTAALLKYQIGRDDPGPIEAWLPIAAASAGAVLFFAVLPASILVIERERIANWLFPTPVDPGPISLPGIYKLGCTLLSFLFIVEGLSALVAGLFSTVVLFTGGAETGTSLLSSTVYTLTAPLIKTICGVILYRYALSMTTAHT